ncbi:MAG: poly-beta-1,6-N-acetyl-D-glucosamine N-deacetylase PgaB, partial [Desulfobaccales bacterium]
TSNVREKDDVAVDEFIKQLDFFKANGYRPISIRDLLEAASGKKPLPEKAILLTFDDAYTSFYRVVFPALKLFNYPAVLSVVTSWIEKPPPGIYGKKQLMTWDQLREVAHSGLVTIASHSDHLHTLVNANPQGNIEPASFTFIYDPKTQAYETDEHFRQRIQTDLAKSQAILEQKLGTKPEVLTWPYGAYNQLGIEEARKLGFRVCLTLDTGLADIRHLDRVSRYYAAPLLHWVPEFKEDLQCALKPKTYIRGVQVDLDKVIEPGSYEASNRNLGRCIDRLVELGVNTVFIQGFCDLDGAGTVNSLYFGNGVLPVKMDFLSHAVNRLQSRGMNVYVWMPALSFALKDKPINDELLVRKFESGHIVKTTDSYQRLSPFDPRSLAVIRRIYRDLAAHVNFNGVLFQDDAFLTDKEDFHPQAEAAFHQAFGAELTPAVVQAPDIKGKWTQLKTETLNRFIGELVQTIHTYRPTAKIARNIYSEAVTNPAAEAWFAQNLEAYLRDYDYAVIMAYPQMEKIGGSRKVNKWLGELVNRVKGLGGTDKVIFKVQAFDWSGNKWIPAQTLKDQLAYLLALGARHVAYYPDGAIEDLPRKEIVGSIISGREFTPESASSFPTPIK